MCGGYSRHHHLISYIIHTHIHAYMHKRTHISRKHTHNCIYTYMHLHSIHSNPHTSHICIHIHTYAPATWVQQAGGSHTAAPNSRPLRVQPYNNQKCKNIFLKIINPLGAPETLLVNLFPEVDWSVSPTAEKTQIRNYSDHT